MKRIRELSRRALGLYAFPFALAFLILNFCRVQSGSDNPTSRFALLRALVVDGTLSIDPYLHWGQDWSYGPLGVDGPHFSSKAPGAALFALPLFALLDLPTSAANKTERVSKWVKSLVSNVTQTLPYFLIGLLFFSALQKAGFSSAALRFGALAFFFGNTLALLTGVFFGHALAAWLLLAAFWLMSDEKRAQRGSWIGLCLGCAVLTDYGSIIFVVPALVIFLQKRRGRLGKSRAIAEMALGALVPAIVWIWYHTVCFGSPFKTGLDFQNPVFGNAAQQFQFNHFLWVAGQLLAGSYKGLLFSQPWMLLVIAALFLLRKQPRLYVDLVWFGGLSLLGLFILNCGFYGWHGGDTPGPRYLGIAMPFIALLSVYVYDSCKPIWRRALQVTLAYSVVLAGVVYATTPLASGDWALLKFYWVALQYHLHEFGVLFRLLLFTLLLGLAWFAPRIRRKLKARNAG